MDQIDDASDKLTGVTGLTADEAAVENFLFSYLISILNLNKFH